MWYLILRLCTKTLLELSRASRWCLTVLSTVPFLVIFAITFLQGFNETHHLHEAIYVFSNFILIQFLVKLTVLCGFRVLFSSAAWRQLTWQITKKKPWLLIRMVWTPILYKILQFRVGAAWLLFVTEIAPKSTSLCVNRIPIRYDFSCRSKSHTVWYEHSLTQHIKKHFQIVISCKRFLFSPFKSQ